MILENGREITDAQLQSIVKRLNTRYIDIVKYYGAGSQIVQQWNDKLGEISTVNLANFNFKQPKGTVIKKPSKLSQDDVVKLLQLEKFETYGQHKKKITQMLKEDGINTDAMSKSMLRKEIISASNMLKEIHDIVKNNADAIYEWSVSITDALHQSRQLTLSEARELYNGYIKNFPNADERYDEEKQKILNSNLSDKDKETKLGELMHTYKQWQQGERVDI